MGPFTHESTVVLVHGAWLGSWEWHTLTPRLVQLGHRVRVVDLVSIGPDSAVLRDLYDDADVLRSVLDGLPGTKVVLGHSYGGMVVSEATAGRSDIAGLIYLAAFLLPAGTSLLSALGGQPLPWWQLTPDQAGIHAVDSRERFFGDCPADLADAATARLRLHSWRSVEQPLRGAGWTEHLSTYVVSDRDRTLPPETQERMAVTAARVAHLDSGHYPALARPDALTSLLDRELALAHEAHRPSDRQGPRP